MSNQNPLLQYFQSILQPMQGNVMNQIGALPPIQKIAKPQGMDESINSAIGPMQSKSLGGGSGLLGKTLGGMFDENGVMKKDASFADSFVDNTNIGKIGKLLGFF